MSGYLVTADPARLQNDPWVRSLVEAACAGPLADAALRIALGQGVCIGVLHEGAVVAFTRIVTDGATVAWVAEAGIAEAHRGQGLSRVLMDAIKSHPLLRGPRAVMQATADPMTLFARFGFQRIAGADAIFPRIATSRLVLRQLGPADAGAFHALHADSHHMRWYGADPMPDVAAARRIIAAYGTWAEQPEAPLRWGITLREDPATLLGTCGLFAWNLKWRKCTIGYELGRAWTGQGLAREAVAAIVDWAFTHRPLQRIEAQVHPDNAASLALLASLGFEREGLLRAAAFWGGQPHDMVQLGLVPRG